MRLADSLATWGPAEPVPQSVVAALPAAVEDAKIALLPAGARDFAVCMDGLIGWVERAGLATIPVDAVERKRWIRDVVGDYRDGLGDLPPDLLMEACRRIKAHLRWRVMPLSADVRATVAGGLEQRQNALRRLKLARDAASRQRPPERPVSDAERAGVKAMMDDFRRNGGLRVVNGGRADG